MFRGLSVSRGLCDECCVHTLYLYIQLSLVPAQTAWGMAEVMAVISSHPTVPACATLKSSNTSKIVWGGENSR
jgi:hypothetical protein